MTAPVRDVVLAIGDWKNNAELMLAVRDRGAVADSTPQQALTEWLAKEERWLRNRQKAADE